MQTRRASMRDRRLQALLEHVERVHRGTPTPSEVIAGAVWEDHTGKLAGDLQTSQGSVSFHGAMCGKSVPPIDPQLNVSLPVWGHELETVCAAILRVAGERGPKEALREITSIQEQLEQCVSLAKEQMAALAQRLEAADHPLPDTSHVRSLQDMARTFEAIGRRETEESAPLSTDPDDYPLH